MQLHNPTTADSIEIVVNGTTHHVPRGCTVTHLLTLLDLDPARVAIELNRTIVRRPSWETTALAGADTLEIVQFVGGG